MKHRIERVKEVVKRELSELVSREINFSSQLLVTVHSVDITPDLRQCHVYVSVMGTAEQKSKVIALLEENRPQLQRDLARRVILKYTPHLHFKLDSSIERGSRVLEIIQDLDQTKSDDESSV
jgi:ribosome-binding factor A